MTLRIAALVALLLGVAGLYTYLDVLGEAPTSGAASRHLRAMKVRVATPDKVEPITVAGMAALPPDLPLAAYSAIERRAVRIEGYIQRMLRAQDNDIHLELLEQRRMPGDPNLSYVTAEITPGVALRNPGWSYEPLVAAFRPNSGPTQWDAGTTRVRITGWLLYDYQNQRTPEWGRPRLTKWEIHPVTRIELWDDSLATFREYR